MTKSRYLIISADEQTWKFDRPIIFLGEWCRNYARKQIWQDMDALIAEPYGIESHEKVSDHAEVQALESKILSSLHKALNQYHNLNHSVRFWQILLGHWLRRYISVMLNRVKTLEKCIYSNPISGVTVYCNNSYSLATIDSNSSIMAFNDDRWNSELTARILNFLRLENCPVEFIIDSESKGFYWHPPVKNLKINFIKWTYVKLRRLLIYMVKDSDAFILASYLDPIDEIKLQLSLRQIPIIWDLPQHNLTEVTDRNLRRTLAKELEKSTVNNLENIIFSMVFELLPICYLEGFSSLNKSVKQQHWPKTPKFIFTANSFDTNEIFKLWTAFKTEQGFKYIAAQHGSRFGTDRYCHFNTIEEQTSDKYLTWGWIDSLPQHQPSFKMRAKSPRCYNSHGGLLLIELHENYRFTTWDATHEFSRYFKEQQSFIQGLALKPRQQLTIRLHSSYRSHKWNEEQRWKEFDPSIKIDTGAIAIADLVAQSRLVIQSYDSTGMLETLAQNIPTLIFWQNGLDHLRDSAKPYYQLLVEAGIIHFTPESAAKKVNEVWGEVDTWWEQSNVQEARKKFCDRYARVSKSPVSELRQTIRNAA
jgi:putative transferase (TIGR04331 family)